MKTYEVKWQNNTQEGGFLMQRYDEQGAAVNGSGMESFVTDSKEVAARVYAQELAYVSVPQLSSLPWGKEISENDTAWKDVWSLCLDEFEEDEDGDLAGIESIESSDYYYFEK